MIFFPTETPFAKRLAVLIQDGTIQSSSLTLAKGDIVYAYGDKASSLYLVESGQINLRIPTFSGRQCLFAIHGTGALFGEVAFARTLMRPETAWVAEDSVLRRIRPEQFNNKSSDSLLPEFLQYLVRQIADQQQMIASVATAGSELRLAMTLLGMAQKVGEQSLRGISIPLRISHQDLSEMIGTTRPRISQFMQRFREKGLVEMSVEHRILVHDAALTAHIESITDGAAKAFICKHCAARCGM